MNSAPMRFVADYLTDHAERAAAGAGALGCVQIDPQLDPASSCASKRIAATSR